MLAQIKLNRIKISYISLISLIGILNGCQEDNMPPEIGFYYWKTIFKLNLTEKNALKQGNVKKLYIRYFDIDLNKADQKAYPLSTVQFEQKPIGYDIIPVIYIKNKVMLKKDLDKADLAEKIIAYTNQINSKNGIEWSEMQIDCDWSIQSRDKFMDFIELLKKRLNKTLSVTIRLHQIKYYYKTKIPSADYGVLMYYNMGKIAPDSLNSVYDQNIAKKYLNSLKLYPLELNIALPIFSRGVLIQNKKVIRLLSKLNAQSFINDTNFIQLNDNLFFTKNSNLKFGYYFKQNDEIKIESISFENLKEMAKDLNKKLAKKPKQIIFFDLDSINLNYYNNENQDFNKITHYF